MKINRQKYYTNDDFGCILFSISRCYNDMVMAKMLQKAANETDSKLKLDCILYMAKMHFGHLKEALKLLDKIYSENQYNNYFLTDEIRLRCKNIENELSFGDNSLNKKYLNIRHSAYHYDRDDFSEYIKANLELYNRGATAVDIEYINQKYIREIGIDALTLTEYFNCNDGKIPKEIIDLYDEVLNIFKMILTENIKKYE